MIVLVSALTAVSQRRLSGKIVEVIDGKTAVVQFGTSGRMQVILQYVEIPEPEQPLHQTVKDHFEKLVNGKSVLVVPKGLKNALTVAQVFVDGVDVSQQMLRDGAAWYSVQEKSGQNETESEKYLSNENLARSEKRGVWGIEGLEPAWEFRAAKAERLRAEEIAKLEEIKKQSRLQRAEKEKLPPPPAVYSNFEMWKAGRTASLWDEMELLIDDQEADQNGLFHYKLSKYNVEFFLTLPVILDLSGENSRPDVACQFGYFFRKDGKEADREFFGLGCRSVGEKESFKNSNELVMTADAKKLNFKKPIRLGRQEDKRYHEMLVYTLNREAMLKVSAAKNVRFALGGFSAPMSDKMHSMVKSMMIEISKGTK